MKSKDITNLYFAYGSNLRHSQMKKRCPHSVFIGQGYIENWQLAFGGVSMRWGGGTATILPSTGSKVYGAVYGLDKHCVKKLDRFETVSLHFYHHRILECRLVNGIEVLTYTYIKNIDKMRPRNPSHKYLTQIIKGAEESFLPKRYVKHLKVIETK